MGWSNIFPPRGFLKEEGCRREANQVYACVWEKKDKLSVASLQYYSEFHFSTGYFNCNFCFLSLLMGDLIKPVVGLQSSDHHMGHKSLQFHQHIPFRWQHGNGLGNSFSFQELKHCLIKPFISLNLWVGWIFNYKEENNHNDLSASAISLFVLMTSSGWNNLLGSWLHIIPFSSVLHLYR